MDENQVDSPREEPQQPDEDLMDASLAIARMLTTGPQRHTLDDILARFGYTREQLRDLPDDDSTERFSV